MIESICFLFQAKASSSQAGVEEILLDAGVVAGGSLKGVISGHHYNRAIRSHLLLCEALERLRWDAFTNTLCDEDKDTLR